jgi:sodium-dependent dicarboxylate transporter 2/3/5
LGALPFAALQMAGMLALLRYFLPREELGRPISSDSVREDLRRMGPFGRGEKFAAGALLVAVMLWALPDLVPIWLGQAHPVSVWLRDRLNWGVSSMLVATSLFVMPIDWRQRKFAMTWSEAAKNIEWGTAALVASALAVGEMIGDNEVGLEKFFSYSVTSLGGPEASRSLFLFATIVITVVLTNLVTNVAVISFMAPIALSVAPSLGLNPIALTTTISFASTVGYAFPMANPPCAMVFASGHVRIVPMFVRGSLLSCIGIILLSFGGYPLVDRIFPWPLTAP